MRHRDFISIPFMSYLRRPRGYPDPSWLNSSVVRALYQNLRAMSSILFKSNLLWASSPLPCPFFYQNLLSRSSNVNFMFSFRQLLWFNVILGLNFIFPHFKLIVIHCHTPKQREMKLKPRIKLNYNMVILQRYVVNSLCKMDTFFGLAPCVRLFESRFIKVPILQRCPLREL